MYRFFAGAGSNFNSEKKGQNARPFFIDES